MPQSLDQLFDQFVKERTYLKAVTPKTKIWYLTAWKSFKASETAAADRLTKLDLQNFVISLRDRGVKPRSVNTYLQALNAFCRWLHEEGHSPKPVKLPLLRTEKRVIATVNQLHLRALLAFKPKNFSAWRIYTLDSLILDTGLRLDEALSLRETNVDFDDLLLTVFGKGQKERRVPMSLELRKVLYRYQQIRERADVKHPLLFATRTGTKWTHRNALRAHYLLLEKLGIPKCGLHRLRHTFASEYLRAGGDVVRLSIILGHSQITTTQKYLHLVTADLQEPHSRLSVLTRLR